MKRIFRSLFCVAGLLAAADVCSLPSGSGILYYVHNDAMGRPLALTNESGEVVWTAELDPFGGATVDEDPDGDGATIEFNVRGPGQYYDKETGLHYNYFRHYDPRTGRYLSSDPIGLLGGLNTYAFALGNPERYYDPIGAGPVSGAAAGGFCFGLATGSTINRFESLEDLRGEIEQFNELIDVAENACPIEERPDWYRGYIERLQRERLALLEAYLRQNGNILPTQAGRTLVCGAVGGVLTLMPFIP